MFVSVDRKFLYEVKIGYIDYKLYLPRRKFEYALLLSTYMADSFLFRVADEKSFLFRLHVRNIVSNEQFFTAWSLSTLMLIFICRSLKRLGCPHSQTASYPVEIVSSFHSNFPTSIYIHSKGKERRIKNQVSCQKRAAMNKPNCNR